MDQSLAKHPAPSLFVREYGTGHPLLLIHGAMVTGDMFAPVIPPLASASHLLVPDLRGHGRSAHLPPPYTVTQFAADLAHVLAEHTHMAVDVIGYSHGGAVAQQLALDYPRQVRRLILACTYAYNRLTMQERLEGFILPWLVRVLGVKGMARLAGWSDYALAQNPILAARMKTLMQANTTPQMVAVLEGLMDFDSRTRLHEITIPTLIIAGSEDRAVPSHHATLLAASIKDARLCTIRGAGHLLVWTHTQQFLDLTAPFLHPVS